MRFMGFVQMEEGTGMPPRSLMEAMETFIGDYVASGHVLDRGGLHGTEDAVSFVVRQGGTTRVDGPYTEVKEVIGGYSVMEFSYQDDAVESMRKMAELHAEHWPEVEVTITLRQISDGPPQAEG